MWNFQKLLSYTSFGGNVVHVLVHFVFLLALVAASVSHVVTAATTFSCCSSNKKMSPLFFSRWASLACRLLSLLLCLSLALYSKFVDMTINLSLMLEATRIQKQFPLSVFVVFDSLVVSALQDGGGYAISRQNNRELYLGCHFCWLSYFKLVCLWCGPTVGRTVTRSLCVGHVITKFF